MVILMIMIIIIKKKMDKDLEQTIMVGKGHIRKTVVFYSNLLTAMFYDDSITSYVCNVLIIA